MFNLILGKDALIFALNQGEITHLVANSTSIKLVRILYYFCDEVDFLSGCALLSNKSIFPELSKFTLMKELRCSRVNWY